MTLLSWTRTTTRLQRLGLELLDQFRNAKELMPKATRCRYMLAFDDSINI